MDTLYLHIGYGKSGTTAIQKYAFRHFNDQKVFLPKTGWWKEGVGHHHLTNDLDRSIPDSTLIPKWENTISELLQANTKKGFISSEQLCFFEPEQIELIHGIISRGNWAIKIIFFVRNQLDLILSSYLEKLKHNPIQKIGDFNFFLAQNKEYFEFSKRLESWERLFGMDNLIVKLYDKSLYSNIVPVLCEIIDVPYIQSIDHDQTDLMTNLSLIPETISLINIFDQQNSEDDLFLSKRAELIAKLINISAELRQQSSGIDFFQNEKSNIINSFKDFNLSFSKKYLSNLEAEVLLSRY